MLPKMLMVIIALVSWSLADQHSLARPGGKYTFSTFHILKVNKVTERVGEVY